MKFQNGFNSDKTAYGRGLRFANVLEVITNTHLSAHMIPGRVSTSAAETTRYLVQRGDVLFNRTSETQDEVGLASVYLDDEPILFGGFVLRGKPISDRLDPVFSGYGLRSKIVRQQIMAAGQGGIRANISQQSLSEIKIALPEKSEQEIIAKALSDTDALIYGLEQLIAKKRLIKQGAMQDILTAKRRLPGFSGEWATRALPELADIRSGGTPSTTNPKMWDGDIAWCTPTDITALEGSRFLSQTSRRITEFGLRKSAAELLPVGTIVMTSRATIGECAIAMVPMSTNQGFKNFIARPGTDRDFLFYMLSAQKAGFIELCSGSTFLEIGMSQLRKYLVRVPIDAAEQAAIACALADMDAEIQALETSLDKSRQVKEGMMQNLLTGRIRLV
jgi:type I restriction enzyme S subunit